MWMAVKRLVARAGVRRAPSDGQVIHHLSGRRRARLDPVRVAVAAVVGMVIDVDDGRAGRARLLEQALGAGGIGTVREDHHVERPLDGRQDAIAIDSGKEREHVRRRVWPSRGHREATSGQHLVDRQQRAQHVGVGMDVAQHQGPAARLGQRHQDVRRDPHAPSADRRLSSSWMRAAWAMERSARKSSSGVTRSSR